MGKGEVQKILLGRVKDHQLAGNIVNLLCENYTEVAGAVAEKQTSVRNYYLENSSHPGGGSGR